MISDRVISVIAFFILVFGLLLSYLTRLGVDNVVDISIWHYVSSFFLGVTFLFLPEYLGRKVLSRKNTWYTSEAFLTILLVLLLSFLGGLNIFNTVYYQVIISILGLGLLLSFFRTRQNVTGIGKKEFFSVVNGVVVGVFLILLAYSNASVLTPLYDIQLFMGKANMDTLFHISISNMFINYGVPSSGLDGVPYYPYHYGTHMLFGGLKNFIGNDIFFFYHISYSAIFISLFYKWVVKFYLSLSSYLQKKSSVVVFNFFLIVIFTADLMIGNSSNFLNHESTFLSLIFSLILGYMIINYMSSNIKDVVFITSIFIICFIITLFKISTGLVLISLICFLWLRFNFSWKTFISLSFLGLLFILSFYVLMFVMGEPYLHKEDVDRIEAFQQINSRNHIFLYVGFVASILLYYKRYHLLAEICFISNLLGMILWVIVVRDGVNFLYVQYFFTVFIISVFLSNYIHKYVYRKNPVFISILLIAFSMLFSIKYNKKAVYNNLFMRKNASILDEDSLLLRDFFVKYNSRTMREQSASYVYGTAHKLYNKTHFSYLLFPSVTGTPLIFGIADKELFNQEGWGFNYYKYDPNNTLEFAIIKAKKMNFKFLNVYYEKDNQILRKQIKLQ